MDNIKTWTKLPVEASARKTTKAKYENIKIFIIIRKVMIIKTYNSNVT